MSERAIILDILAGNAEAFSSLVDLHYDRCARIAVRILGNREDAEEAIQDAFFRAYRALNTYEDRERFSAWLTRILVNQCRTMLAKANRRAAVFPDVDLQDDLTPSGAEGPSDAWPEMEELLQKLPVEQREAIVLRYADDLTYDEMSKITGAGESALKMRVQRAFARLRILMNEVTNV
jgi:RNA polymerase sigma-70 factor (ECF subfamily)